MNTHPDTKVPPQFAVPQKSTSWFYSYLLLAGFNLLTVFLGLYLNHQLVSTQRNAIEVNLSWMARWGACDSLAQKASDVQASVIHAPQALDVPVEQVRRDLAIVDFSQALNILLKNLPSDLPAAEAAQLKNDLADVTTQFNSLIQYTATSFSSARNHIHEQNLTQTAPHSHEYNNLLRALHHLRWDMWEARKASLVRQMAEANRLACWEWLLGGFIFLMVAGAVSYGVRLQHNLAVSDAERSHTEQQLRIRAKAMEAAATAIAIADRNGKITWSNPAYTRLTGYSPEEALGQDLYVVQVGQADADFYRQYWDTLSSGKVWDGELTRRRKDGKSFTEHVSITPVRGMEDTDTCYIAIKEDITERKDAEFRAMLLEAQSETAIDGMLIVDSHGQTLLANRQFGEMWKIPQHILETRDDRRMLEHVLHQLANPEEFLRKVSYLYDFKDEKSRDEIAFVDGRCFDRYSAPLRGKDGKHQGRLWFFRDITERKTAEAERELMRAQLIQSQKLESIGTLASGVAHEINNPINGIMNYAQLLMDRVENGLLRDFAGMILKESNRVATIVRNLLTFARPETQSHMPARMCDIVQDVLSLIQSVLRNDQIAWTVDLPQQLPMVSCRKQQIQQVLMNLLANSRDALNEKYPGAHADKIIQISARARTFDGRAWVRVTVEDHGVGVPEAIRKRIFDPFFSTKPKYQGTGLGLAISHGIAREHGGHLTIESEMGVLTRMHLDLPAETKEDPWPKS